MNRDNAPYVCSKLQLLIEAGNAILRFLSGGFRDLTDFIISSLFFILGVINLFFRFIYCLYSHVISSISIFYLLPNNIRGNPFQKIILERERFLLSFFRPSIPHPNCHRS